MVIPLKSSNSKFFEEKIMDSKMKEKCQHEWVQSLYVIATNPPIYQFICKKCGAEKEERGQYFDFREYDRIKKKFE